MLLIDIGNTRIKWAMSSDGSLGKQHATAHAGWTAHDVREQLITKNVRPSAVAISNVGGAPIGQLLADAIRDAWQLEPYFARVESQSSGVRCGYPQPEKLGIDRWLGVIAAHHWTSSNVCVASVGTALTVDGVLAHGQHLGGVIAPGPDMMVSSLMRGTSDIARHAAAGQHREALFADNTLAAVHQGSVHALAALIERCVHDMSEKFGVAPTLLVTGGACDRVARELRIAFDVVPDLVLRGLSIVSSGR
jgi:type III pantothenate kinase